MKWLDRLWRQMKRPRTMHIGPVGLLYRFVRHVPVSDSRRGPMALAAAGSRGSLAHLDVAPGRHRFPIRSQARDGARSGPEGARRAMDGSSPAWPAGAASAAVVDRTDAATREIALVVGVGPGLGHALVRTFAAAGMQVAMASRNAECLEPLAAEIAHESGRAVLCYGCDATDETSVADLMARVTRDLGAPSLVVFAVQGNFPGRAIDVEVYALEQAWRQGCLGGFIVAREAARCMVPLHRGTILLVGSTSGLVGREDHLVLSVGKFGLRSISQVMARELGTEGVHVVHVVIDADIQEDAPDPRHRTQALPQDIASTMLAMHRQPRSCWTSEIDVRPWNEHFWQHC